MFLVKKCFTNSNDNKIITENQEIFFGWQMECDKNNVIQKAYEIKLFNGENELIWQTGKVQSSQSIN